MGMVVSMIITFEISSQFSSRCYNAILRPLTQSLILFMWKTALWPLWTEVAEDRIRDDAWTGDDPRLCHEYELPWAELDPTRWAWKTPLRSDFACLLRVRPQDQNLGRFNEPGVHCTISCWTNCTRTAAPRAPM
jgi:hypothetical protein